MRPRDRNARLRTEQRALMERPLLERDDLAVDDDVYAKGPHQPRRDARQVEHLERVGARRADAQRAGGGREVARALRLNRNALAKALDRLIDQAVEQRRGVTRARSDDVGLVRYKGPELSKCLGARHSSSALLFRRAEDQREPRVALATATVAAVRSRAAVAAHGVLV